MINRLVIYALFFDIIFVKNALVLLHKLTKVISLFVIKKIKSILHNSTYLKLQKKLSYIK